MTENLKILILEDVAEDAGVVQRLLQKAGMQFDFEVAADKHSYLHALQNFKPDVILADHTLPQFNSVEALELMLQQLPGTVFILVTGTVSEEFAASVIKKGADDYILKDRLTRLPAAINAALKHKLDEKEKIEFQKQIAKNEEKYHSTFERITDAFVALDTNWRFTYINKKAGEILDREPATMIGKNIWNELPEGIDNPFYKTFHRAMEQQQYIHVEEYYKPYDRWFENHIYPSPDGLSVFFRDISEKKIAEQKIRKANRLYFFISQINQMIVRTTDETTLFKEACRIAVELGQFRMAWIGMLDEATKRVIPVMHAGEEEGYLSKIKIISVADKPEGRGPIGTALREGKYIICNDIENDPQMAPWKEAALGRGYLSLMALPIKKFGHGIGAFTFYADVKNFFDAEEIALLEEATGDVSFALEVFEKERQHKKAEEALKESEELLRLSSDLASVAAWEYDVESNSMLRSSNHDKLYGLENQGKWERETFIGATHPEDREKCNNIIDDSLAIGGPDQYKFDFRIIYPDKTIHWLNVIGEITERNPEGFGKKIRGFITDITERKTAELGLQESEEKYRTLVEQASDAIFIYDVTGNFLDANNYVCKLSGYTKEEILKRKVIDLVEQEHLKLTPLQKEDAKKGLSIINERKFITKDGRIIEVELSSKMLSDGRFLGIARDITERKKVGKEILKSEERYRDLVENITDLICTHDLDGRILSMNKAAEKNIGFKFDPQKNFNLKHILTTGTKNKFDSYIAELQKTGRSQNVMKVKTGNGEIRIWQFDNSLKTAEGKPPIVRGYARDITEQKKAKQAIKESEEKFRTLVQQAPDGIFIADQMGNYLEVNESMAKLTGYSISELTKINGSQIVEAEDLKKTPLQINKIQKEDSLFLERVIVKKDGTLRNVEISTKLMLNGKVICIMRDITERKKAEQAIYQLNVSLEQRVKERTAELEKANAELEEINDLFVGREARIIELKEELEVLKNKLRL